MTKPIKHAISLVIMNPNNKVLFALRSKSKKSHPLVWSLPSAFTQENESYTDTIIRIGDSKLGVKLTPGQLLIDGTEDRENFILHMHNYIATVDEGNPHIMSDDYIEISWFNPIEKLDKIEFDDMGKCTSLYRDYLLHKKNLLR